MRKLALLVVAFSLLLSCGGGGGGSSGGGGESGGGATYPTLDIFYHNSEHPIPQACDGTVYYVKLVARCLYRVVSTGREIAIDRPADFLSEPPNCVERGHLQAYRYFTSLPDPSAYCPDMGDLEFLGSLWVIRTINTFEIYTFSSPYFGTDAITLDPITLLSSYPYPWWGSDLTSGEEAKNRMDLLSQYAGFPSYPQILSPSEHENFLSQVKANLGLPSDAPMEMVMNSLMEKRLEERGVSFGEYFASLPNTTPMVLKRSFRAEELSSFPSVSPVCTTSDTFACPFNDTCTTSGYSYPCLRFHSGKLSLRLYYNQSKRAFSYCFQALDTRTNEDFFVGKCSELYFDIPSLAFDEIDSSYERLYCEDAGIPFTIRCYAEVKIANISNPSTPTRTVIVSNYFTFDLARYEPQ